MRSNLGRFRRTTSRSLVEQLATLTSVGDGSTLSLDFTTGVLDPRLTFTRTTNATFINSSGLVEWAGANAMTQSNDFSVSPWAVSNVSVSIDGTSPVGNAWKILENSANDVHRLNPGGISSGIPGTGVPVSISIHVKQGSGSRQAYMLISDNGTGDVRSKRLDPVTGTLVGTESSGGSWSNASTSVQNLGNGWYRLTLTATRGGGSALICRTGLSDSSGNLTYQGDGTSFLYFSGHQINPGSTAQQYYATTGSAYHTPRFDYDPSTTPPQPRGLLIEGSASNLLKHSQGLFTSWIQFGTVGALTTGITSPSGDSSAVSLDLNTAGNNGYYTNNTQMGYTNTVGGTYTFSIWVRATGSTTNLNIRFGDSAVGYSANIPITTSWQRLQYSYVAVAASGPTIASATGTATGVVELWGAQLEIGAGPSSYIPTGASQGSRAADNCVTAIGNLTGFNANQGTIYESWRDNTASDTTTVQEWAFAFGLTGANGVGIFVSNATSGTFGVNGGISNTGDAGPAGTYVIGGLNKAAIAIDVAGTSMKLSANGSAVATGTNIGGYNTAQTFSLGQRNNNTRYLNGWIRQFKYWPYLLPDAQLTNLTTL